MSSDIFDNRPYLGAMLRMVWQWVRDQIAADVARAGYEDLRSAHIQLFRFPSPDGVRPSELAAQLQLSKQSVNELLSHLEQSGYLVREPDPVDGRARVVRLTTKGRRLERTAREAARSAELRIAKALGPRQFAALRSILDTLTRDLAGTDVVE